MKGKYEFNSIDEFDEWDDVFDYESDVDSVIFLDKNGIKIAEFGYSSFDDADLYRFKNKSIVK